MPIWSWSHRLQNKRRHAINAWLTTMTFTCSEKSYYKNIFLHHTFCTTCPRWAPSWNVNVQSFMYNRRDNACIYWDNPTVYFWYESQQKCYASVPNILLFLPLLSPVVGRWITVSPAGFTLSWQTPSPPTQRDQPENEHHLRVRSHHVRLTGVEG